MSQFPPGKSWSLFSTPLRWSQSNEEDSNMILVMHIMVMMTQVSHKTQYVIKKAGGNVTLDCTDFTGEQEAAWRKIGGVVTFRLIICSRVKVWKITNSAKLYLSILLLRKRYVALNEAEEHSFQELFSLTFNILLSIRGHRDIYHHFKYTGGNAIKGLLTIGLKVPLQPNFGIYQLFTKRAHAQMQWRKSKKRSLLYCSLYSGFENVYDEPFCKGHCKCLVLVYINS